MNKVLHRERVTYLNYPLRLLKHFAWNSGFARISRIQCCGKCVYDVAQTSHLVLTVC